MFIYLGVGKLYLRRIAQATAKVDSSLFDSMVCKEEEEKAIAVVCMLASQPAV